MIQASEHPAPRPWSRLESFPPDRNPQIDSSQRGVFSTEAKADAILQGCWNPVNTLRQSPADLFSDFFLILNKTDTGSLPSAALRFHERSKVFLYCLPRMRQDRSLLFSSVPCSSQPNKQKKLSEFSPRVRKGG